MGICSTSLKQYVIQPVLKSLGEKNPMAETLLLATSAYESELGTTLKSARKLGIYGVDKHTHRQIWDTYLVKDPELASRVRGMASQLEFLRAPHTELVTNLTYATAIAWCCYQMNKVKLPDNEDAEELAACWQLYFRPDAPDQAVTIFASTCQGMLGFLAKAA